MENTDLANPISLKTIRTVLREWDSLKTLGECDLVDLEIVRRQHHDAGYTPTVVGYGLALREVFQNALESLRPDDGAPNHREKRWRPYIILKEQFLNGRKPDWVKEQLHISKGAYYGEQEHALTLLAEVFQKWELEVCVPPHARSSEPVLFGAPFMAPPQPVYRLLGRDEILDDLKERLTGSEPVKSFGLIGLPGVGKTAALIALAHAPEIQAFFSDGILWTGLGRSPDTLPLLGAWATALGISDERIANRPDIASRMVLIHSTIGMRRMLLIIDDAWDSSAALAFKVGGPNCAYLVTARLADVPLEFGVQEAITLHELSSEDGIRLIAQIAPKAMEAAPQEIKPVIESVAGLPLALILIGGYLQRQSYRNQLRRLREAIEHLANPQARINLSQSPSPLVGQPPMLPYGAPLSLQSVIGLSDAQLDKTVHQALVDLALFPPKPNSFSEEAATAVCGTPESGLDILVDSGLVESCGSGRYTIHQTIHDYAATESPSDRARSHLAAYFSSLLETYPATAHLLDQELANIIQAVDCARTMTDVNAFIRLVALLYRHLELCGLYELCVALLNEANELAQAQQDVLHQTIFEFHLGSLEVKRGNFISAKEHLFKALSMAQSIRNIQLESAVHMDLSLALSYSGDSRSGKEHIERSIELGQSYGLNEDQSFALVALGYFEEELCNFTQAILHLNEAVEACQAAHSIRSEGWSYFNLSLVYLPLGNFSQAQREAQHCQQLYEAIGDPRGLGWLVYHNGRIQRQLGHYEAARRLFDQAVDAFTTLGDRMGLGFAMHNSGMVASEMGDDILAYALICRALDIFEQIHCVGIASAHYSLGKLALKREDYHLAAEYFRRALENFHQTHNPRGVAKTQAELALTTALKGDLAAALELIHKADKLITQLHAAPNQAFIATLCGHVHLLACQVDQAEQYFQKALDLRVSLGQSHLRIEPLAGLAAAAVQRGMTSTAVAYAEKALQSIEPDLLDGGASMARIPGLERPLETFCALEHALAGCNNVHAQWIKRLAAQEIHQTARQIENADKRSLYLEHAAQITGRLLEKL